MSHLKSTLRALRWNAVGTIARFLLQFGSSIALARLLGPEAFGVVAAAMTVVALGALLSEAGLGAGLIAADDVSLDDARAVQTLQFVVALALCALCFLARHAVANAFNIPALSQVLPALALQFPLQALGATASAMLKRELNFRALQTAQVGSYAAGYVVVGGACALLGAGVWSLVAAQLTYSGINSVLLIAKSGARPRTSARVPERGLLVYGAKVTLANLGTWLGGSLDTAIVGRLFGVSVLGYYSRAATLVTSPSTLLVSLVQSVLFPAFARARSRGAASDVPVIATIAAAMLVAVPGAAFVAFNAERIVRLLFGPQWLPAAPVLAVLVVAFIPQALTGIASSLLWSHQKMNAELAGQAAGILTVMAVVMSSAQRTPELVAVAVLFGAVVRATIGLVTVARAVDVPVGSLFGALRPGVLLGGATALVLWLVASRIGASGVSLVLMIGASGLALVSVCVALVLCAPSVILPKQLREVLRRLLESSPIASSASLYGRLAARLAGT